MLEKEIIMQVVEGSILCSQDSATGCCPEPVEFTPSYNISLKYILISHLCLGLQSGHFLSGFPLKFELIFLSCSCMLHVLLVLIEFSIVIIIFVGVYKLLSGLVWQ